MSDISRNRLTERLEQLRQEQQSGEHQLTVLQSRIDDVRQTLLRISGAVQVLEEELSHADQTGADRQEHADVA